jgi:signal transduction histidine kinase
VNTIQCLEGWGEQLELGVQDTGHMHRSMARIIQRLTGQVKHHRMLMQAERGELKLQFGSVQASEILSTLQYQFRNHELVRQRTLRILPPQWDQLLVTDRELLHRVLTNMVLNALEATPPGGEVRVWHQVEGDRPGFHVHNPGHVPPEVASQIFHRSFSTKGGYGRGLGTYGMKLLGEDHLGGTLRFRSTPSEGTQFTFLLPRNEG